MRTCKTDRRIYFNNDDDGKKNNGASSGTPNGVGMRLRGDRFAKKKKKTNLYTMNFLPFAGREDESVPLFLFFLNV